MKLWLKLHFNLFFIYDFDSNYNREKSLLDRLVHFGTVRRQQLTTARPQNFGLTLLRLDLFVSNELRPLLQSSILHRTRWSLGHFFPESLQDGQFLHCKKESARLTTFDSPPHLSCFFKGSRFRSAFDTVTNFV